MPRPSVRRSAKGLGARNGERVEEALAAIETFEKRRKRYVWPHVDRVRFTNELVDRVLSDRASTPRVVLITDRFGFSSCLIAVDLFRRLGALHVGEETDRDTWYAEVRESPCHRG